MPGAGGSAQEARGSARSAVIVDGPDSEGGRASIEMQEEYIHIKAYVLCAIRRQPLTDGLPDPGVPVVRRYSESGGRTEPSMTRFCEIPTLKLA